MAEDEKPGFRAAMIQEQALSSAVRARMKNLVGALIIETHEVVERCG